MASHLSNPKTLILGATVQLPERFPELMGTHMKDFREFTNLVVSNLVVCNFYSFALFCTLLRPFALLCALLRSFAFPLFCTHLRSFACTFVFLRLTVFRTTAFGNCRDFHLPLHSRSVFSTIRVVPARKTNSPQTPSSPTLKDSLGPVRCPPFRLLRALFFFCQRTFRYLCCELFSPYLEETL